MMLMKALSLEPELLRVSPVPERPLPSKLLQGGFVLEGQEGSQEAGNCKVNEIERA